MGLQLRVNRNKGVVVRQYCRVLLAVSAVGKFEPRYFASARGLGPKARRMRLTWDAHLYMHKKRNKR